MIVSTVSAYSNTTFNNTLAEGNITFAKNNNITLYFSVPENTYLSTTKLNISSLDLSFILPMHSNWLLDESSGTTANDNVGNYNGVVDGATWIPGLIGNGLNFTNDAILNTSIMIPDEMYLEGDFTISMWANFSTLDGVQVLIDKGKSNGNGFGIWMDGATDKIQFQVEENQTTQSQQTDIIIGPEDRLR